MVWPLLMASDELRFCQVLTFVFASQVVCIRSTWNTLSPKLSCDTRPLILKTLSELFSLVPSLTVNTAEYEVCVWISTNCLFPHWGNVCFTMTFGKKLFVISCLPKILQRFQFCEHDDIFMDSQEQMDIHPYQSSVFKTYLHEGCQVSL